jgi:hypothetical protein
MFPEPTDILQISVNARRPAPPYGGLGSVFEASAFFDPAVGTPCEMSVMGRTELIRAKGTIPDIAGRRACRARLPSSAGHGCAGRDRG